MSDDLLKQYVSHYKNPEKTKKEIINVLQTYKSLTYRQETFKFSNNSYKELINLQGTIPVLYKGNYYNIPVCIWLVDTHPANAPICFVKPTPEMEIKVSQHVDSTGKVYLPYLHEWNSKSSLLQLIQDMSKKFGEQTPLYTKPRDTQSSYPGYGVPANPPYPVGPHASMPFPNYPGYPTFPSDFNSAPSSSSYPAPAPPTAGYPNQATTITEEHIRASLLSAVEDKLKRRLREQSLQSQAELDTLRRTQGELESGRKRLDDVIGRLNRERESLESAVQSLEEKEKELDEAIAGLENSDGIDVDEAVTATAPLYAQLLDAFAREATAEDAAYYLGEALRKGRIDLDTFLKQVRELSRQQFTMRATMQKCREKAGLACS